MIETKIQNQIYEITLVDLARKNVLSEKLIADLNDALRHAEENDGINCILLQARGDIFSAGADLKEIAEYMHLERPRNDFINKWHYIYTIKKPIIVAIDGACFGGGMELAFGGDVILVSKRTEIAFPEFLLGGLPGGGGCFHLLQKIGYHRAFALLASGCKITAHEALSMNLVSAVLDDVSFSESVTDFVLNIASAPQSSLLRLKKTLTSISSDHHQLNTEKQAFYACLSDEIFQEGVGAFLTKRKASWK